MLAGKTNPRENFLQGRATKELGTMAGVSHKTYEHAVTVLEKAPELNDFQRIEITHKWRIL